MTFPEAVMRPITLIVTRRPAWFWGIFRLLVWQETFSSALAARRRQLRRAPKKLMPVQNASHFLASSD